MKIVESYLTKNRCYTAGRKITVKGLMLHSVGCNQPSANAFVNSFNTSNISTCVHAFIDGNNGTVYQTLPWNHRGWHGGGDSNNTHIGIEMCEPACIKYKSNSASFACSDLASAQKVAKTTYNAAVELFAYLCKLYNLNPTADGVIISHSEGAKRGIASNHADPEHLWKGLNLSYTMNGFRQDVKNAIKGGSSASTTTTAPTSSDTVVKGDLVSIASDAVYYDGSSVPSWVRADKWYISSISGNRAVLGRNASGTHNICSAINVKYLTAIKTKKGDVNGDGDVTAADGRTALRASAKLENLTEEQKRAADMNNDGNVTAADVREIMQKSSGVK